MIALLLTSLALAQSSGTLTITVHVVEEAIIDTAYLTTTHGLAATIIVDGQCTIDAEHDWSRCATVIPTAPVFVEPTGSAVAEMDDQEVAK